MLFWNGNIARNVLSYCALTPCKVMYIFVREWSHAKSIFYLSLSILLCYSFSFSVVWDCSRVILNPNLRFVFHNSSIVMSEILLLFFITYHYFFVKIYKGEIYAKSPVITRACHCFTKLQTSLSFYNNIFIIIIIIYTYTILFMYILFFYLFLNEYYNIECINKSILYPYTRIYTL